jgi:hypothetical protein
LLSPIVRDDLGLRASVLGRPAVAGRMPAVPGETQFLS